MSGPLDQITRDIARKCDADVAAAIDRNMSLVGGGIASSTVALSGAASALGCATGAFLAVQHAIGGATTGGEEAADALWQLLRPMVVRSVDRLQVEEGRTS